MPEKFKKILLSGGGTGGSVTPLLAVAEDLKREEPGVYEFLFVGTRRGPENILVKNDGLKFKAIVGGKWRRYFSFKNIFDLFKIIIGFFQSFIILLSFRPRLVMSAGGFVSVPLVWAAWILGIPVLIHQQDIRPGLANKLMAPCAKKITVTFAKSVADYGSKAVLTGNPVKGYLALYADSLFNEVKDKFKIAGDRPLVLVIGGGTGSEFINNLVKAAAAELVKFCQVIHITGRPEAGSGGTGSAGDVQANSAYQKFSFLPHAEVLEIMKLAAFAVSRCGLGVLTELSALGKPAILIPMPQSHQEDNARIFAAAAAALVLEEKGLTPEIFLSDIKECLSDKKRLEDFSSRIREVIKIGNDRLVGIVRSML